MIEPIEQSILLDCKNFIINMYKNVARTSIKSIFIKYMKDERYSKFFNDINIPIIIDEHN